MRTRHTVKPTYLARLWAGDKSNRPLDIVDGDQEPYLAGETWHYTTPGGKPIYYPNAYRWRKQYHPSTLRIQVGREWLEHPPQAVYDRTDDVLAVLLVGQSHTYHGATATPGWVRGDEMWLVRIGDREYHQTSGHGASARHVIRAAMRKMHARRHSERARLKPVRRAIREAEQRGAELIVRDVDAFETGYCAPGVRGWADRHGFRSRWAVPMRALVRHISDVRVAAVISHALRKNPLFA